MVRLNYLYILINNENTTIPLNASSEYCNKRYAAGSVENLICNNAVNDTCSSMSDPNQAADCDAIYEFLNRRKN